MGDIFWETVAFATKAVVISSMVALTAAVLFALARKGRGRFGGDHLEITPLNQAYDALGDFVRAAVLPRKALKELLKARKHARADTREKPVVYVLDFEGDLLATATKSLRTEVTALAAVVRPGDEVVVRLESGGGAVPHYGLAAAQLARLRERQVKVTVCIDRVAASGGYMMACVADSIVAAPFAVIGSIGVIAQVPNLHRLLKKHDVDYQEMTAGEFKRTVSVFAEITEKGRQKFQAQLEDTHTLFKEFVKAQRPKLNVDHVSTGEYWLGRRALELGLVDQLSTSDDYLLSRAKDANLFRVHFKASGTWRAWIGRTVSETVDRALLKVLERLLSLELR